MCVYVCVCVCVGVCVHACVVSERVCNSMIAFGVGIRIIITITAYIPLYSKISNHYNTDAYQNIC